MWGEAEQRELSQSCSKRHVSLSVCLDMTDWKLRIRWFELVVLSGPGPEVGLSQRICKVHNQSD